MQIASKHRGVKEGQSLGQRKGHSHDLELTKEEINGLGIPITAKEQNEENKGLARHIISKTNEAIPGPGRDMEIILSVSSATRKLPVIQRARRGSLRGSPLNQRNVLHGILISVRVEDSKSLKNKVILKGSIVSPFYKSGYSGSPIKGGHEAVTVDTIVPRKISRFRDFPKGHAGQRGRQVVNEVRRFLLKPDLLEGCEAPDTRPIKDRAQMTPNTLRPLPLKKQVMCTFLRSYETAVAFGCKGNAEPENAVISGDHLMEDLPSEARHLSWDPRLPYEGTPASRSKPSLERVKTKFSVERSVTRASPGEGIRILRKNSKTEVTSASCGQILHEGEMIFSA